MASGRKRRSHLTLSRIKLINITRIRSQSNAKIIRIRIIKSIRRIAKKRKRRRSSENKNIWTNNEITKRSELIRSGWV